MAIVNISGTINSSFTASGVVVNAAQAAGDAVFTIDLRPVNPIIIVQDNLDYGVMGWNINDAVAVIILSGPQGEIYRNEDFDNPDIVPATSRYLNKIITLPLDPLTDYANILKGNYTLKISWYNSVLDEYYNFLDTYQYNFDPPTIENTTTSGPYTGVLTSTDTTEYGLNVHQIIREHRIQYPTQLAVPPADVVSSNAEIQVTPIYTNQWNIQISSFVEYRNPDTLRIYWEGEGEFTHCVYGGCIGAMYDAIETMLATYTDSMACNVNNQEDYQKRLVIVNTAWHLLNEAYWSGDAEEADQQAYIIQEQVAYTGSGICEGSQSELVTPCPPWTGGGVGGTYTFSNALVEAAGNVTWGGSLVQATTVLMSGYEVLYSGSDAGNTVSQSISASGGVLQQASDGVAEARVYVEPGKLTFGYVDVGTPANSRLYDVEAGGLVEQVDYSASYTGLNLVNKNYVDSLALGLTVVATDATISGDGTPGDPLSVATPFPGFTDLLTDYGYVEPVHEFSEITNTPTTLVGYGITDAVTAFTGLSDTPGAYTGFGSYFLQVNPGETGIQFVTGTWVPVTGGTFTGQITIATSTDRPLIIQQIGAGSNPGSPEGGTNLIAFQDNDGDEQGYVGIDNSGNVVLSSWVTGGHVLVNDDLNVNGDITPTGIIYVDTILERTPNNGVVVESVTMEDGGITLVSGATVNEIETVLTDDDTHIPTSGAVFDALFTGVIIDTDTTIYVETTGDDVTGDGTTVPTAFATLQRALEELRGKTIANCTVIIQLGVGTFESTAECVTISTTIKIINGGLIIQGTTGTPVSLAITEVGESYSGRYTVDGGIPSTDYYKDYKIIFNVAVSSVIGPHDTSELHMIGLGTGTYDIEELQTTLIAREVLGATKSTGNSLLLTPQIISSRKGVRGYSPLLFMNLLIDLEGHIFMYDYHTLITFYLCSFKPSSDYDAKTSPSNKLLFQSLSPEPQFEGCTWDIRGTTSLTSFAQFGDVLRFYQNKVIGETGLDGIRFQHGSVHDLFSVMFDNIDLCIYALYSSVDCKLYGSAIWALSCGTVMEWRTGTILASREYDRNIYLYDTDYLLKITDAENLKIYLPSASVIGDDPNIAWLDPTSVNDGYYDPAIQMDIVIPGIFREVDTINEETLVDNGITYQVVGDTQQNRSVHLMYTIERGTTYQEGEIKILYDGTAVFILDDFQDNVTSPGVAFTADINGTEIRLIATATSTGDDATFKAQVRRIMHDGGPTTFQYIEYDTTTYAVAAETLYQHGIHYVRRRIVGNVYHIDITIDGIGFAGAEDVNWGNLISINGQDSDFRSGERGGNFVVDCEITATGFAGTEDTDWENLSNSAGGGALTIYRDGIRAHAYVIDKVLTATGFAGTEDVDWENLVNYKIP